MECTLFICLHLSKLLTNHLATCHSSYINLPIDILRIQVYKYKHGFSLYPVDIIYWVQCQHGDVQNFPHSPAILHSKTGTPHDACQQLPKQLKMVLKLYWFSCEHVCLLHNYNESKDKAAHRVKTHTIILEAWGLIQPSNNELQNTHKGFLYLLNY